MQRIPFTARVRRARTRSLVAIGVGAAVAFVAANVMVSLGGTAGVHPPPPASLSELVLREAGSAGPEGISANFRYVNGLVPDTSSLPQVTGSGPTPLLEGAHGRLWWGSGRLRMEFQTDAGDTQLLVHGDRALMYDAAAGNAFSLELPSLGPAGTVRSGLSGAAQLLLGLGSTMRVSQPVPGITAGRPSYTVTMRPTSAKSLIGAVAVRLDAETGTPLRADVYGRRSPDAVVELALSQVHYGWVSDDVFHLRLPFGMHPAPIRFRSPPSLSGPAASCAAPPRVASLQLTSCRVTSSTPSASGRVLVYGRGLGAVFVLEEPGGGDPTGGLWDLLPSVAVGRVSGKEISTTLGCVVRFGRGGVTYTVAGSRPQAVVRAVARAL